MADDIGYTPGSGATIAADDVGGILYQRVKPVWGADGSATDSSSGAGLPVALTDNLTTAFTTTTVQAVASTDAAKYSWVSVHFTSAGTSSVTTFQGSNDNTNWVSVQLYQVASIPGGSAVSATGGTAGLIYAGPLNIRYFRLNVTGISAGTTAGSVQFSATPRTPNIQSVTSGATAALADTTTNPTTYINGALAHGYNGATWDRVRTPNTFKTVATQATGNTALWTPTSGKKFRLQRIMMQVTADAATSGGADITIDLKDGSTTSTNLTFSVYVPAVGGTAFSPGFQIGWLDLGIGVLSSAANNVLNVNLSAALTAGYCRVIVAGVEE